MKETKFSPSFKKDLKKVSRYPKFSSEELKKCIETLATGNNLDSKYSDHKMAKQSRSEYIGTRNFHLKSNICVIYRMDTDGISLIRIGSHQDLQLTESTNLITESI